MYSTQVRKKVVKQQYLLHIPCNMANFGSLTAEIGSGVWGTPANFNGFGVLFFFLSIFFPHLFSAVADWMFTTLPHMMWS